MATRDNVRARLAWTARMVREGTSQARFPFLPLTTVTASQERRLGATVAYARAHVPYYRETMRSLGLGPEDIASAPDLAKLPLLERDQVQRDPEYFLSREWPADACVTLGSGGTTGAPLTVFRDPPSFFAAAAHEERIRSLVVRLVGRRLRYREAQIRPEDSSFATAVEAFRRRTLVPVSVRVERRVYSMLRSPAELLPELDGYRPDVITAYGSYLDAMFTYIRETGARPSLPRVVTYGSDSMSTAIREWVRRDLGIEVLSSYNAIETPQIGFECDRHRGHHLNVDLCPVRLIGADGRDVADDEPGEIVVSNLVNRATVLLNYRLGDVVSSVQGACPCGRVLPMCSYPGRTKTTWLDLGGGRTIHAQALRLVLRAEREIWRYQIVHESEQQFRVRLIPSPSCDRDITSARIEERFREQLGRGVAVSVEFVAELPRGPSGKVQPVLGLSDALGWPPAS